MKQVCVVGAGLAGACAAYALSPHVRVTLLDRAEAATGASGVAAGIVNPFAGPRSAPVWHRTEALAALETLLVAAKMWAPPPGIVRPARDGEQAQRFRQRSEAYPDALAWLGAVQAGEQWPDVHAPLGALVVGEGRAVDVAAFVRGLLSACPIETRFGATGEVVRVDARVGRMETAEGPAIEADVILLCTGAVLFQEQAHLPLHHVKGQIITLHAPGLANRLPLAAGDGYLVPNGEMVLVGSTFEHVFDTDAPTAEGIAALHAGATSLVPALAEAPVVEARAGIRTTVPGVRRPLLGPISRCGRLWVFNGLGAKGLLTAPLLAARLWTYLNAPASLPNEIRPPMLD